VPRRHPPAPKSRALVDLAVFFGLKCPGELLQEQRNAVGELCGGGRPSRPFGNFGRAPCNELVSVVHQESSHSTCLGGFPGECPSGSVCQASASDCASPHIARTDFESQTRQGDSLLASYVRIAAKESEREPRIVTRQPTGSSHGTTSAFPTRKIVSSLSHFQQRSNGT
jgi:hypothetical protein